MSRQKKTSFPVKISLFFMLILSLAIIIVSGIIVFTLTTSVRSHQTSELKNTQEIIYQSFISNEKYFTIPYNITYSIFNSSTKENISTNDPLLPFLKDSKESAKRYFVKNYFSDGDLNILFISSNIVLENELFTIVTAMDIDSDYATEMIRTMPKIAILCVLPILLICFLISVFITTKMMEPFEREKQFSNDVSHELKTPLSIINGHVSLLLRWGKSDKKLLDKSLQEIKKETKSMQKIIENLLQISRYESGRLKPEITEFSVIDFFTRLQSEFSCIRDEEEKFNNSKIEFYVEKDFMIKSDQEMLHQVFVALISNSIKYNQNGCTIKLKAAKKGKSIIFEEEDNGIGLDEKIIPFIFDRFFRGESSHNQKIPGNGLGLSISKTLIATLNGKITAENATPKGALFKIEL